MKSPESPRVLSKSFRDPKANFQFELLCNQILMCAYFSPTPKGFCGPVPMFPFIYPSRSSPLYIVCVLSNTGNFLHPVCWTSFNKHVPWAQLWCICLHNSFNLEVTSPQSGFPTPVPPRQLPPDSTPVISHLCRQICSPTCDAHSNLFHLSASGTYHSLFYFTTKSLEL